MKITVSVAFLFLALSCLLNSSFADPTAIPAQPVVTGAAAPTSVVQPQTSTANAAQAYTDKPLAGVKGVAVLIEDLDYQSKASGLNATALKKDVEAKLRKAGVPVVPIEKCFLPKNGYLYVNIDMVKIALTHDESIAYSFDVSLAFGEDVILLRDVPIECTAHTWNTEVIDASGLNNGGSSVRRDLSQVVTEFCKAYLDQNKQ